VEALASDDALERLAREEVVARAGRLAGATSGAEVPGAVEALRAVVWMAAMEALSRPSAALVSDLAQRLAHVCAVIASASLARDPAPGAEAWEGSPSARDLRPAGPAPAADVPADAHPGDVPADARRGDTRSGDAAFADRPSPAMVFADEPSPAAALAEGPWREAIEARLARGADDEAPFAALLVEVDGLERLLVAETGREVAEAIESVEGAISGALRSADALVRGGLGRYWIVGAASGPSAAHELALDLGDAVGRAASHRGIPLTVSVGFAVWPDDGEDARELAEHAEQRMFAARASGVASLAPVAGEG
jgi:GGDEF domain-containing protein